MKFKRIKISRYIRLMGMLAACLLCLCTLTPKSGYAQTESGGRINRLAPVLPTIPPLAPRPDVEPGTSWNTVGDAGARRPVASFVDSLKGTDSAFEVIVGQARLLTMKEPFATEEGEATIAIADPTIIDFDVLPNSRMLRILGRRVGVTELSITTSAGETYSFEVHVIYDLKLLDAHIKQAFPDSILKIGQLREHLVVEGQARSQLEAVQIVETIQAFLVSVQVTTTITSESTAEPEDELPTERAPRRLPEDGQPGNPEADGNGGEAGEDPGRAAPESEKPDTTASFPPPQIINLIRVPGVQQVMLSVRIAELDRTSLREIGADLFYLDSSGRTLGSQIGGSTVSLFGLAPSPQTTSFAVLPNTTMDIMIRALRQNSIITILAEPNLTALSGHEASFLAGGEFPVPVPTFGGGINNIAVQFKEFGVLLNFTPYVLDDESIRLRVAPEVSSIDESIGLQLAGFNVPGVNTRRAETTVELKQGETLALAGLLQVDLDASTSRIPGLGDLPYIGSLFSNTTHERQEKELLVLVTPHLISPLKSDQSGVAVPGEDISDPNDLEFYFMNRIEGRTGHPHRPTTNWDDPLNLVECMKLESHHVCGPIGFSTQSNCPDGDCR